MIGVVQCAPALAIAALVGVTTAGAGACSAARPSATNPAAPAPTLPATTLVNGPPSATSPGGTASVTTAPGRTGALVVANGHGWSGGHLDGPVPPSSACHTRTGSYEGLQQPLPDPSCTPGAIDPAVSQADLGSTICRRGGYTSSVRPPESVTGPAKVGSMRSYGVAGPLSAYEYDHLVPLGLGGASDTRNLWPELDVGGSGGYTQNAKDAVETELHDAVCAGRVALGPAQQAIASNWTTAMSVLRLA